MKAAVKILVLGAYGMLGHELFYKLGEEHDVYATARKRKDVVSQKINNSRIIDGIDAFAHANVEQVIEKVSPDVVINCIGLIKQLSATSEPTTMMYLNSVFPHEVANLANTIGARVIHFSTDCVFSGKRGRYTIQDRSDAEDLYGQTKYLGELPYKNCLTIRSSIIGPELETKNGLLGWLLSQKGKAIRGYKNAIYSGFTTLEMSRITSLVIDKHPELHGVWQVASEPISKFDLLTMINERMELDIDIEPDWSFICDRSLDGSEFNEMTGYLPPDWPRMINEMIIDFRKE
jgi:dTDP-4-dehydrorhamnose reductase